jgi:hypothetical protein
MEKCRMKPNTSPTHSRPLLGAHSGLKRWRSTTSNRAMRPKAAVSVDDFEMRRRQSSQHVLDKVARVEWREVIDAFAGADEAGRNAEFVLNGDDNAALAAAVEFRDDQSG